MPIWAKRLLATLAIAGALLAVLALALPLAFRGPRLAWLVERSTRSLCGTIRVGGGHLGVLSVFDILVGRPAPLQLDGLSVVAPDGDEVLATARVSARIALRLRPLRADVYDLRLARVRWTFVEHAEQGRVDFVDVFKSLPGGDRAFCLAPPVRHPTAPTSPRPAQPPAFSSAAVEVHGAVLDDVDLRLDFAMWALVLDGTSAHGTVGFETTRAGPRLHFEVRDIDARRGGSLRVGPRGHPLAAQAPFDEVRIDRFSTLAEAPADMLLEVGRASTGRSVLAGRAQFTDIFPWGRRAHAPGLDLDARWTDVGDVVEALKRGWGLSRRLPGRLDGHVSARLRGPFTALAGRLDAAGPHARFDLGLAPNRRVDAQVGLDGLETDGVLDPSLAPLLAGHLFGHLHAHVQFGGRVFDLAGALDEAALRLDRTRGGPWPRRLIVSTHAAGGDSTPETLDLVLKGARFDRGVLAVHDVGTRIAGAPVSGAVSVRLLDATGAAVRVPIIDARGDGRGLPLDRLVPGGLVRGQLTLRAEIRGPSDSLEVVARFPPGAKVQLGPEPLTLPARIEASLRDGDKLALAPVRLGGSEGGAIELGGAANFNGAVDARLAVLRYPLGRLLALTGLPLAGHLDSNLHVTGQTQRPRIAGQLAFSAVRLRGEPLGDGAVTLVPAGDDTLIDGRVVPAVGLRGRLSFHPGPRLAAHLLVDDFPLAPLAGGLRGFAGRLSAEADARLEPRHVDVDAQVGKLVASYRVPGTGYTLALQNDGPAHLQASERAVALGPARLRGDGIALDGEGTLDEAGVRAHATATLTLLAFAPLVRPWLKETAGVASVDLRASGPLASPSWDGVLTVREPLRLWPRVLSAPLQIPAGAVAFDGTHLEARGLTLSLASATAQLDGAATLAPTVAETRLDLQVRGTVDGAALSRRLPAAFSDGRGRITADGHIGGTAGVPSVDGHVDFAGFGAILPDAPVELRSVDGRIEARGHTFSTSGLRLSLAPGGQLQVGTPEAPAVVDVASLQPPDVGTIAVRVRGHDLATGAPVSGLRLQDLDLQVGLDHALDGPLRVAGDVWIQGASFAVQRGVSAPAPPALKSGGRVAKELFPDILLDVAVHSKDGALAVPVPYLPDLSLTVDCRVAGSYRRPRLGGRLRGDGLYSRLALFLYDAFSDKHLRRCGGR